MFLCVSAASGFKILFISPLNQQSHWLYSQNVIKALLNRHHEVTCITPLTWPDPKPTNYTEILVYSMINLNKILLQKNFFQAYSESPLSNFLLIARAGKLMTDHILSNADVQRFLLRNDLNFDLVINEEYYMESLSMFAFKFNAPLITISSHGYSDFFDRQFGLLTPWSHVPHTVRLLFCVEIFQYFLNLYWKSIFTGSGLLGRNDIFWTFAQYHHFTHWLERSTFYSFPQSNASCWKTFWSFRRVAIDW